VIHQNSEVRTLLEITAEVLAENLISNLKDDTDG